MREVATSSCVSLELATARRSTFFLLFAVTFAAACTMVDLQTEALIAIAVIGIALVSFGLYPIAKMALSQRKPSRTKVSATSEERDRPARECRRTG